MRHLLYIAVIMFLLIIGVGCFHSQETQIEEVTPNENELASAVKDLLLPSKLELKKKIDEDNNTTTVNNVSNFLTISKLPQ